MEFRKIEIDGDAKTPETALEVGEWCFIGETGMILHRGDEGWQIVSEGTEGDDVVIFELPLEVSKPCAAYVAERVWAVWDHYEQVAYHRGMLAGASSEREKITYGFNTVFGDLFRRGRGF